MPPAVSIVGQGLAGSILGWLCETSGVQFEIFDLPAPAAASRMGAGIINPITGQRWVKSWRIEQALPIAVKLYRELETTLGTPLLTSYRVRRLFRSEREKNMVHGKLARGEFDPFANERDETGIWFAPAYRVDTALLVERLKSRWVQNGRWKAAGEKSEFVDPLTIFCRGAAELGEGEFPFASLTAAKGEIIEIETGAIDSQTILNQSHWLLPLSEHRAWVGASFEPGDFSDTLTPGANAALWHSAKEMLGDRVRGFVSQRAGTRVISRDKHPVIGRHPRNPTIGIFNGLGSKGALLAPWLGWEWLHHLVGGETIDLSVDVARFWSRSSAQDAADPKLL